MEINKEQIHLKELDITEIDLKTSYFHYTDINNLENIALKGLEPKIGNNSKGIEESEKIFFVIGEIGILAIMDVWLKWLILRPSNDSIYRLGAYLLKQKWFPKIVFEKIFKNWTNSKIKNKSAYKKLKSILNNSIFLVLDLEENVDFCFNDIDEVKSQNIPKEQLKYIYFEDELKTKKMDYWNMHTYSNKTIETHKIALLKMNNIISSNEILKIIAQNNNEYINNNCYFLKEYLFYLEKH